jgi:hypothetical protein
MGQRGPARNPQSRRGRAEAKATQRVNTQAAMNALPPVTPKQAAPADLETPTCPEWLSEAGKETWCNLVALLLAADVSLLGIDTYALAMAAYSLASVAEWGARENMVDASNKEGIGLRLGISKLVQKYQQASQSWLEKIGATPSARLRMGIKGKAAAVPSDPWGDF